VFSEKRLKINYTNLNLFYKPTLDVVSGGLPLFDSPPPSTSPQAAATMSGSGYRVPANYPETPMSSSMPHSARPMVDANNYYSHVRTTSAASSVDYHPGSPPPLPPPRTRADSTHQGVQTGQIGGGFGPYAVSRGIPHFMRVVVDEIEINADCY